jgi:hypothetical protein
MTPLKNYDYLLNTKINRWTILELSRLPNRQNILKWHAWCICDCINHTQRLVRLADILNNTSCSCGCYIKEWDKKCKKKYNTYSFEGDIGTCYTTKGVSLFIFDKEDFDIIKDVCWSKDIRGYASGRCLRLDRTVQSHRLILGFCEDNKFDGIWVDHINRNPLDNRKVNLRIADKSENRINSSIRSDNTSGVIGVSFLKDRNRWNANICLYHKSIYIGDFKTREDAIIARLNAEKKYFGEYAPQKHLFEEYGI